MKYFELIVIAFGVLLVEFEFMNCSDQIVNSPLLRKEVDDFEEWLREKVAKEPSVDRNAPVKVSVSNDANDYLHDDEYEVHKNDQDFKSHLEKLSRDPNVAEIQSSIPEHEISSRTTENSKSDKRNSEKNPKRHFPLEEILFIRRSDSELNDPIPELVEKLVHDLSAKKGGFEIDHKVVDTPESTTTAPNIPSTTDSCSVRNVSSNMHDVCRVGPEYEIRFHPEYSKILRQDMEKMLPEEDPDVSQCDYRKLHGPKSGVEDRALCPFKWRISNRNPSRIPEYLFEAKCSCQLSREIDGEQLECVPIKRAIPVLWVTECRDGKKKQKLGWEEISVACAPLKVRESNVIELDSVE